MRLFKGKAMNAEQKVRSRHPKAVIERLGYGSAQYCVWDVSREERSRLSRVYWPTVYTRALLGFGATTEEAWESAVRDIERREGRRLPIE
jgi:hypothetical protein